MIALPLSIDVDPDVVDTTSEFTAFVGMTSLSLSGALSSSSVALGIGVE